MMNILRNNWYVHFIVTNKNDMSLVLALIFWVHCESAYSHWLEERKAVADEVSQLNASHSY